MDNEYWIKVSDTAPPLEAVLTPGHPDDRDLSGATVTLWLQATFVPHASFSAVAEVVDAAQRYVRYTWPTPVPLAPGVWAGEWRVVWSDSVTATFPNHAYFYLKILAALPVVA